MDSGSVEVSPPQLVPKVCVCACNIQIFIDVRF